MWWRESSPRKRSPFVFLLAIGLCASWAKGAPVTVPSVQLNYQKGELGRRCSENIEQMRDQIRVFIEQESPKLDDDAKVLRFDQMIWNFFDDEIQYLFMSMVHSDAGVRAESESCERQLVAFATDLFSRQDLYQVLNIGWVKNIHNVRLASMMKTGFFESGLSKGEKVASQIKDLQRQLNILEQRFEKRLKDDKTVLVFRAEELKGVPKSVLSRFEKTRAGYAVSLRSADVQDVLTYADVEETRKKLWLANESKPGAENTEDLETAVQIRQKIASLLKVSSWAALQTRTAVSGNPSEVRTYIESLHEQMALGLTKDLDVLEAAKRKADPNASALQPWDFAYFQNQLLKTQFGVDTEEFQSYFPADQTVDRFLRLFGWLFGVTIENAPELETWDPTVRAVAFKDTESGQVLGYVYLDLFQRKDKFNHAAAFQLRFGMEKNGVRQIPITAVVSNFTPSAKGAPSTLTFQEIETLVHELGHIFHFILSSKQSTPSYAGFAVPTDFVEAPSQFFEYFARQPEVLQLISGKAGRSNRKIALKTAQAVVEHEAFFQPLQLSRVVFRTMLDLQMHLQKGKVDTTALSKKLYQEYVGIPLPEGATPQASFGHLMGGYDGKYYSYLVSRSFSAEFFKPFGKAGVLSEAARLKGMDLRKKVFEPGYSDHPVALCQRFLKRRPEAKTFFKEFQPAQ